MKTSFSTMLIIFSAIVFSLSGCEVIGGIFKAGVWTGVIIVVAIIALVIFIISRMAGKK